MINFHSHSFFSDGVLSPAELLYRCKMKGYRVAGISDHVDESNFEHVIKNVRKVTADYKKQHDMHERRNCVVFLRKRIEKVDSLQ